MSEPVEDKDIQSPSTAVLDSNNDHYWPEPSDAVLDTLEFLVFAHKEGNDFKGAVVFEIIHPENQQKHIHIVDVDPERRKRNRVRIIGHHEGAERLLEQEPHALNIRARITAEREWFLKVYAGDVDPVSAVLSGKIYVHRFAFNEMSAFSSAFNFSTESWKSYYSWKANPLLLGDAKEAVDDDADDLGFREYRLSYWEDPTGLIPDPVVESVEEYDDGRQWIQPVEFSEDFPGTSTFNPVTPDFAVPFGLRRFLMYRHFINFPALMILKPFGYHENPAWSLQSIRKMHRWTPMINLHVPQALLRPTVTPPEPERVVLLNAEVPLNTSRQKFNEFLYRWVFEVSSE